MVQMRIPDNGGLPNEDSFLKLRLLFNFLKAIIIKFQNQPAFSNVSIQAVRLLGHTVCKSNVSSVTLRVYR